MKRSKSIDLERMRKKRIIQLSSLSAVVGGSSLLSGCGITEEEVHASVFRNLDVCKSRNYGHEEVCNKAYDHALKRSAENYPSYQRKIDCLGEFGSCRIEINDNGTAEFIPENYGFMLAELSKNMDDAICYETSSFVYQTACYTSQLIYKSRGDYYTADGDEIEASNDDDDFFELDLDFDVFKKKKRSNKPLGKGGFGKKVAKMASRSKSSSFSFGG